MAALLVAESSVLWLVGKKNLQSKFGKQCCEMCFSALVTKIS